jgi:hypothetical protein
MSYRRGLRRAALGGLLLGLASSCGQPTLNAGELAGTYVYERTSSDENSRSYVRRVLTLHPDWTWEETAKSTLNGRPAVDRTETGSFSFHQERIVVLSTDGVTRYRIAGDTLWSDHSQEEAMERAIFGQKVKLPVTYYVRRRTGSTGD